MTSHIPFLSIPKGGKWVPVRPIVWHCLALFGQLLSVFKESHLQGSQLSSILVFPPSLATLSQLSCEQPSPLLGPVVNIRIELLFDFSVHLIATILVVIDFLVNLVVLYLIIIVIVITSYVDLCPSCTHRTTHWAPR